MDGLQYKTKSYTAHFHTVNIAVTWEEGYSSYGEVLQGFPTREMEYLTGTSLPVMIG
ncbi:hypothetical protein UACE39S_06205 [Ureibacillus acetophenoni]